MRTISILFSFLMVLLISACGPSQKEKEETAIITCNIIGESRNMDAATRIKEINSARDQIGEEKYLSTDKEIKESVKYGLCKELVLNDPEYANKLNELKRIEREAIAKAEEEKRKKQEAERIAREKREAEERAKKEAERIIAREKREAERIAREKREAEERAKKEAERIAREKREAEERAKKEAERKANQKKWRKTIGTHISNISFNPTLLAPTFEKRWETLTFAHTCNDSMKGINTKLIVVLKDNKGTLTKGNPIGYCGYGGKEEFRFRASEFEPIFDDLFANKNILSLVDKISLEVTGTYSESIDFLNSRQKKMLDSQNYGLRYAADLDEPFVYTLF